MLTCYYLAQVKHSIAFDELLYNTFANIIQPINITDRRRDIRIINFKREFTNDPREKSVFEEILIAEGNKKHWIFLKEVDSSGNRIKDIITP